METLHEVAGAPADSDEAAVTIAELAITELDKLAPGVTIGTSTLLQRMGAKYHQLKPLYKWLGAARFDGLLDPFWTENTKRLAYGKPTIDWHAKRRT